MEKIKRKITAKKKEPRAAKVSTANDSAATKKRAVVIEKVAVSYGLHRIECPAGAHKKRKIKGRGSGSGHGKTSTRGSKGQTSRSGKSRYLGFEGGQMPLIRRIAKRGFTSRFKKEYQLVNLRDLKKIKEANINPDVLKKSGLIKDSTKPVKILGDGEILNPVTVTAQAFSRQAEEKIKNSGGKIEIVNV